MGAVLVLSAIVAQVSSEPASFRAGVALVQEGRLEEAERAFLEALAESPSHAPSSVALARLYSRSERFLDARRTLEEGLLHHPRGIVLLNELGSLLLAANHASEAVPHFQRALAVQGENPRARAGLARSLFAAGEAAYSLNRDVEAAELLEGAASLSPVDAPAWILLGKIHYRRADHERARGAFERALEADPASEEARFYLGEIDRAALRFEEAVGHYQSSSSVESLRGLAQALQKLERYDEAEEALENALSLSTDPETFYLLGSLLLEKGETDDAVAALVKARALDPHHLEARYLLGTLLARLGRVEDAREELDTFRKLKSFEEEKEKLAVAILERPGEADSYRPLIQLYHEHGRDREALPYLEKALQLAPEDPELLDLRRRIQDDRGAPGKTRC
ncbi:MAG: tetratricopeptide repeat protein [Vicinamibacteria bacterium]